MAYRKGIQSSELNASLTTTINITTGGISISCHVLSTRANPTGAFITLRTGFDARLVLGFDGTGQIYAESRTLAGATGRASGGAIVSGTWTHLTARFASASVRQILQDNSLKGTDLTLITAGGSPFSLIECFHENHTNRCSATIRFHDLCLYQPDITIGSLGEGPLSNRMSPFRVKPNNLHHYWKLQRGFREEIHGDSLVKTLNPSWGDNRIISLDY